MTMQIPPPPAGWAIVPKDDSRLDCLPYVPKIWDHFMCNWKGSSYKKGQKVSDLNKKKTFYALPIEQSQAIDPKGEAGKDKAPMELLPPVALTETAWVHGLGAAKYGRYNWRENRVKASTYVSAIMRHLAAWQQGEDIDPESGRSHLAHIAAGCNILMDAKNHGTLEDDRAK